jgi:hypothetical protein
VLVPEGNRPNSLGTGSPTQEPQVMSAMEVVSNLLGYPRAGGPTSCMPCSFGLLPHPRSEPCAQPIRLRRVTVTVRQIPLVTAALWHAGSTAGENGNAPHLAARAPSWPRG